MHRPFAERNFFIFPPSDITEPLLPKPFRQYERSQTSVEFKELYPSRVTLGQDGVYRWSFDVNLEQDHYVRDLVMKVMFIICAGILVFMLFLMASTGDFSMLWVPLVCCGFAMLIASLVYRAFRKKTADCYTLGYEMREHSIRLVHSPATRQAMGTAGAVTAGLMAAAGQPARGLGQGVAMGAAAQGASTSFRNIRSIRESPETNMLNLRTHLTSLQVWVCSEDYDMVRRFIEEHRSSAAQRQDRSGSLSLERRCFLAAVYSAVACTVIGIINGISFAINGRLPISRTTVWNETATQDSIGLRTQFIIEGSSKEEPWWMNRLEFRLETALIGFLALALLFFLVLTVVHVFRKGRDLPGDTN